MRNHTPYSLIDTSLTFVQYSVCPQSSSFLSTYHLRDHDDSTHASAWLKSHLKKRHLLYSCAPDIIKMSVMVAEPDSITYEKRISLLHKEQIIDMNSMIQMNLDTYESMTTLKQNLRHPCIGDDETVG